MQYPDLFAPFAPVVTYYYPSPDWLTPHVPRGIPKQLEESVFSLPRESYFAFLNNPQQAVTAYFCLSASPDWAFWQEHTTTVLLWRPPQNPSPSLNGRCQLLAPRFSDYTQTN